jgi:hypothetical protein
MTILLAFYIAVTIGCFTTFLWPDRRARRAKARMESGEDSFFEERRAYRAYPSLWDPRRIRTKGAVGTVLGLFLCAMELWRG